MKKYFLLIFCTALLAACGAGSGEGLDENGNPVTEPEPQPEPEPEGPSLEDLVNQIFNNQALGDQRCTRCHSGGSPAAGMSLQTPELAYANLVGADGEGVTANGNATFKRILPGDPDESYIILKLEGDIRAGNQMPLGEAPLTPMQIALVRDWIANGAPETGTGTTATVISKVSTPTSDELQLHFSRKLLADQNLEDVLEIYFVENGDSWLASPRDYVVQLDGQNLIVNFVFPETAPEAYTVKINSPQTGVLLDSRHIAVDGNNNKQEGGVFSYEYRVQD